MKVVLCGGGTAGHINPALAIGDKIKRENPDAQLLYVGAAGGMEETLVPKAGVAFKSINVMGFRRSFAPRDIARNVKAAVCALTSQRQARSILREFSPDMVIGTGGYVSGPVVLQATKLGIKTAIHEQNAYPGVTTKLLASKVTRVMVAVPQAVAYIKDSDKCIVVGNPVRSEFFTADRDAARRELGAEKDIVILSFGGSLGAQAINNTVADLMVWEKKYPNICHIHATGSAGKADFLTLLKEKGINADKKRVVLSYIHDMPQLLAAADLVICRAGASTLSELEVAGKGSILIPYPYASENHQYHNAKVLADRGAAIVIEQKDLTSDALIAQVGRLVANPGEIFTMSQNAHSGAIADTADRIYQVIATM